MKKYVISILIFSNFIYCRNIDDKIMWKHRSGYHIRDVFITEKYSTSTIKNDTLYINGIPKAVIIDINYRINDLVLNIKEINGSSTGSYVSK